MYKQVLIVIAERSPMLNCQCCHITWNENRRQLEKRWRLGDASLVKLKTHWQWMG